MKNITQKKTKPQSNIIDFPQPPKLKPTVDLHTLIWGEGKNDILIVSEDRHYVVRNENEIPIWVIARVAY